MSDAIVPADASTFLRYAHAIVAFQATLRSHGIRAAGFASLDEAKHAQGPSPAAVCRVASSAESAKAVGPAL